MSPLEKANMDPVVKPLAAFAVWVMVTVEACTGDGTDFFFEDYYQTKEFKALEQWQQEMVRAYSDRLYDELLRMEHLKSAQVN